MSAGISAAKCWSFDSSPPACPALGSAKRPGGAKRTGTKGQAKCPEAGAGYLLPESRRPNELVRRHHITSHFQQATPCNRHGTGSKLERCCSSSRGKQPELATLAAWSPLQEPQNTSCVGRRWKRETAAPARAGQAARRPVAAQASLDPSFLWMVVAPSLRHPSGRRRRGCAGCRCCRGQGG